MRYLSYLLLISVFALAPIACARNDAPDERVSANADRSEEPAVSPELREKAPAPARPAPARNIAPPPRTAPREPVPAAPRNETRRVDRSDEAVRSAAPAQQMIGVPAGTRLTVALLDAVGTEISREGDAFSATLAEPITVNGRIVAERGARVSGRVRNIEEPGKVKGRAKLELELTQINVGNRNYRIETESFMAVADDSKERDAAIIGGGAGVGAIIGGVTGGGKGAAIGAAIGGGSGTAAVLMTKGKQLRLEPETRVNFVLSDDVSLPAARRIIS